MPQMKSVLVTGANAGLGKESARQLALLESTERVYLGCRNLEKAEAAKAELEQATRQSVFEILQIDVMDLVSVRAAVRRAFWLRGDARRTTAADQATDIRDPIL